MQAICQVGDSMGLIMLVLIGTVPTAYALNKAVTHEETRTFVSLARDAATAVGR
jgi:PiT family inorganic phosphate transporter